MVYVNLAIRFIVELLGIGFVGYWGWNASSDGLTRAVLAIGVVVAMVAFWALVAAPTTNNGLSQPQKNVIGTVALLVAAVALAAAGQPVIALVYAVVVIVNIAILTALGGDAAKMAMRQNNRQTDGPGRHS